MNKWGSCTMSSCKRLSTFPSENGLLLVKYQQLKVEEIMLNDMLVEKIDDLVDGNEKLERELVSYKTFFEASPMKNTATTIPDISSFGGDVIHN